MTLDYENFKTKLEEEKLSLEKELKDVGRINPDNSSDWEAVPSEKDSSQADPNTVADNVEDYEDNLAIVDTLESKYRDVLASLDKITQGTYGKCNVCGKEISPERLEAIPSAQTCTEHME